MEALVEARTMAAGFAAVHEALGNEANDEARASERNRILTLHLNRFNELVQIAGREPVVDRPGGVPALRHIGLVVAMDRATA